MLLKRLKLAVAVLLTFVTVGAGRLLILEQDEKGGKPALSGSWGKKGGHLKIEFADKNVMKIAPHGDSAVLAVVCAYTVEKDGLVSAKVTRTEGKAEAKKHAEERLPAGLTFTFRWTVKGDTATLDGLKGDKVDALKHLLVGEFEQKHDSKKRGHNGGERKGHKDGKHNDKEAPAAGSIKVGDTVKDFSARTVDGKSVKLSELQKDAKRTKSGVVVLSFWCTTCDSCRDVEKPLATMGKHYEGQAAVFAVTANADETAQDVAAFLKKKKLPLPVVLDPNGDAADLFGVKLTTTTVVIDGKGVLRYCGQFRQKGGGSAEAALKAVLAGQEVAVKTTPHRG